LSRPEIRAFYGALQEVLVLGSPEVVEDYDRALTAEKMRGAAHSIGNCWGRLAKLL
jgi:hypothetical protein